MAGIAGMTQPGETLQVEQMLEGINHRGQDHRKSLQAGGAQLLAVWNESESTPAPLPLRQQAVWDGAAAPLPDAASLADHKQPFALAAITPDGLMLARDRVGVKPLYYAEVDGRLAFASEVKALLPVTGEVREFPPGHLFTQAGGFRKFAGIQAGKAARESIEKIAAELRLKLEQSVLRRVVAEEMGSWLSGGLDSSAIAALARPHVRQLHSFVSGVKGAPDLEFGRQMAEHLGTKHHEVIVTLKDMLAVLPEVIYHLESFDALLVRSSITNYLTAKLVSEHVGAVFSGEGGDELFAGYDYIKDLPAGQIPAELEDIIQRLHNTALQRVDRSAQAHGVVAMVPFTDPDVLEYALRIPGKYKVYRGDGDPIEKWILRKAVEDLLPESVLWRTKAKFWQGAGVQDLLGEHAEAQISDADFARERTLPNGWTLNSKEELMYYRVFRERFGELEQLDWMGRTKGAPVQ